MTDRAQLLVLFKSDMISPLFQAVEAANLKTMQGEDDQHYLFLKRMVQLLVELGGQVCGIWHEKNSSKPENFNIYLNALLAFTNHNSHTVNYYANELWAKFCRHVEISKDDVFQTFIPKWVECALKKVILSIFLFLEIFVLCHCSKFFTFHQISSRKPGNSNSTIIFEIYHEKFLPNQFKFHIFATVKTKM